MENVAETNGSSNGKAAGELWAPLPKEEEYAPSSSIFKPVYDPSRDLMWSALWWLRMQGESHHLPAHRVRNVHSAVRSLMKWVQVEETPTVEWCQQNMALLKTRWVNKANNGGNSGESAREYESRMTWLLKEYIERCADPTGYKPSERFAKFNGEKKKRSTSKEKVAAVPVSAAPPPPIAVTTAVVQEEAPSFGVLRRPVPEGARIMIDLSKEVPEILEAPSDLNLLKVRQIVGRLAARCVDWDMDRGVSEQVFQKPPTPSRLD